MAGNASKDHEQATMTADQAAEVRVARADWQRRITRKVGDTAVADRPEQLPAPAGVKATGAMGHIRLDWERVSGAAGYLIERTEGQNGRPSIITHGGSDVAAVSTHQFADTGLRDNVDYRYRIGAVPGAEYPASSWSEPVSARIQTGLASVVAVRVDASKATGRVSRVWHMVGSERLSQLFLGGTEQWISAEFAGRGFGSEGCRAVMDAAQEMRSA